MDRGEYRQADENAHGTYVIYDARTLERLGETRSLRTYGCQDFHVVYMPPGQRLSVYRHCAWYIFSHQWGCYRPVTETSLDPEWLERRLYGENSDE